MAGNARKQLESEAGKGIVKSQNYLATKQEKKVNNKTTQSKRTAIDEVVADIEEK